METGTRVKLTDLALSRMGDLSYRYEGVATVIDDSGKGCVRLLFDSRTSMWWFKTDVRILSPLEALASA